MFRTKSKTNLSLHTCTKICSNPLLIFSFAPFIFFHPHYFHHNLLNTNIITKRLASHDIGLPWLTSFMGVKTKIPKVTITNRLFKNFKP